MVAMWMKKSRQVWGGWDLSMRGSVAGGRPMIPYLEIAVRGGWATQFD